jgi:hypothetical protein
MADNKYKTGKIYTILFKNDDNWIYVGSTILYIERWWLRTMLHNGGSRAFAHDSVHGYAAARAQDERREGGRAGEKGEEDKLRKQRSGIPE